MYLRCKPLHWNGYLEILRYNNHKLQGCLRFETKQQGRHFKSTNSMRVGKIFKVSPSILVPRIGKLHVIEMCLR